MIRIDCRVKNNKCYFDDVADLALENSDEINNIYEILDMKTGIDASFAETSLDVVLDLAEKVDMLAAHIGLEFDIEPEVPAIPAKLVLKKIVKKPAKKSVKKTIKKAVKKVVKKVAKKK